jgi:hypothetical protein
MKTPRFTATTASHHRCLVLALTGIMTAILCVPAVLHDRGPTGNVKSESYLFIKITSLQKANVFIAPLSAIVMDMEKAMPNNLNVK